MHVAHIVHGLGGVQSLKAIAEFNGPVSFVSGYMEVVECLFEHTELHIDKGHTEGDSAIQVVEVSVC